MQITYKRTKKQSRLKGVINRASSPGFQLLFPFIDMKRGYLWLFPLGSDLYCQSALTKKSVHRQKMSQVSIDYR